MREKILSILTDDCRITPKEIAVMLSMSEDAVIKEIADMESQSIIVGYRALVDYERANIDIVTAIIELKVTPQLGEGFDAVAEKIYKFPQVKSLYLMSGGYDLSVVIEGATMKEVALFVAESLSPMDNVISTATHFVLRKYKDSGRIYINNDKDDRQVITL